MIGWSPDRYLRFRDERTRPARDLLAAVPLRQARGAIDLGCGPGNSTELLIERFPDAVVTGVDNSADMLAEAARRLPGVAFEEADIACQRRSKNASACRRKNASGGVGGRPRWGGIPAFVNQACGVSAG